jgi:hypothetical protein
VLAQPCGERRAVEQAGQAHAERQPGKNGKAKTVCRASSFTIIIKAGSLYPLRVCTAFTADASIYKIIRFYRMCASSGLKGECHVRTRSG